ncbi:uncharacterized protein LOC125263232 isoform X1 [Megalobrama amblycephala]|uniref:uncharacterized protein LOC125263232 isoform X1 n=1 Tax=Megalobrama amblycephala TaxID=75352 RepID=UPI002013C79A|nr:uncharacterized protein LOC125263232 isoform X1 [Megalobrama amblycephala]
MFLKLVLLCLCLWRLDGGFGIRGEVKYVNVKEGDSVTLDSDLTEMKDDDVILWRFENTLIAEISKQADRFTVYNDVLDGRFRDRLKLDNQTGSLTITNITMKHAGRYRLYTHAMSVDFLLAVKISVTEGDSITLNTDLTEMKDDGVILWRFENTLIAEISKRADRFTVYDDVLDGRFRDRLKLDKQTGSLTITDITMKHAGDYKLQINYMRVESFFLTVIDKVESVSVTDGDSVTLNIDPTEMKDGDEIQWRFGNTLIAEISKRDDSITVYDDVLDGRFRDRLKMHKKTGSLTITDVTTEHAGVYKLQIIGRNYPKTFRVSVSDEVKVSVKEGDSVALKTDLTEIQTDDLILWTFGPNKSLIAKLNRKSSKISIYDDVLDGRFRDRLKLDHQTGSLTITNTRTTDSGLYEGTIEGKKEIRYRFSVSVSGI